VQAAPPAKSFGALPGLSVTEHLHGSVGRLIGLVAEAAHPEALAELCPQSAQGSPVAVLAQDGDGPAQMRYGTRPDVTRIGAR
jgi:hypothetical protein